MKNGFTTVLTVYPLSHSHLNHDANFAQYFSRLNSVPCSPLFTI